MGWGSCGQAADGESPEGEHSRGGLGKKMKAISMTMRKKMGRKYAKALSEEAVSADASEDESDSVFFLGVFAASAFFSEC